MTTFFIPGVAGDTRAVERAYDDMRKQVEVDMGRLPNGRRILSVWTRRGGADCVIRVGTPDRLRGMVTAIFDMGPHQPFVVWWQPDGGDDPGVREVLSANAYSVGEFD